jgi:hypothetical protein
MKNAFMLLMLYSAVLTVFLIAYFLPIKKSIGQVVGSLNFSQRFILIFALSTIMVVVGIFILILWFDVDIKQTNIGQVGDFIGGLLNPILSFLALIAIVISISVQEKELSSTVSALKSQEEIFKIQNFESSLYNLMGMQRSRRSEQVEQRDDKVISTYVDLADKINAERARIDKLSLTPMRAHILAVKYVKARLDLDSTQLLLDQFTMINRVIKSANLTEVQRRYYTQLAYSDFTVDENIVLSNVAIVYRSMRRRLREYNLPNVNDVFFISPILFKYFRRG